MTIHWRFEFGPDGTPVRAHPWFDDSLAVWCPGCDTSCSLLGLLPSRCPHCLHPTLTTRPATAVDTRTTPAHVDDQLTLFGDT